MNQNHKSVLLILVFFVLFCGHVPASYQSVDSKSKPDLSGTWLLDTRKSNKHGITGGSELPITISHQDPEFRVTRSFKINDEVVKREFVYFTDGRGETNDDVKSKTKWSGNKIEVRGYARVGNFAHYHNIDHWELSRDGKILIKYNRVIHSSNLASLSPEIKLVYNRN